MQANYYLDLRIMDSADDGELTLAHLRNQIYSILHAVFREIPNTFALALEISPKQKAKMQKKALKYNAPVLPQYDVLRMFATEQHSLEQLIDKIKGHWKIRDYAILNHPAAVPTAKVTGYKSYFRFRIPTLNSERNATEKTESRNAKRLKQAKKMPYFQVASQTTGQGFTVNVEILDVDLNHPQYGLPKSYTNPENAHVKDLNGLPDSYGLARKQQAFALPVFEVI